MKTLLTLLSLALTSQAAHATPSLLLQYSSANGSVNPMYGHRMSCIITSDGNVTTREIVGDIAKGKTSKIKWTGIPNVTVLKSLILDAKNGKVVNRKGPLPIGGRTTSYIAYKGEEQLVLSRKVGELSASINTSEAAARLIGFIKVNCGSVIK